MNDIDRIRRITDKLRSVWGMNHIDRPLTWILKDIMEVADNDVEFEEELDKMLAIK